MNDRIAVKVIDERGDALFQLVFRVDANVAEHGASGFGKEPLDEVQPGTVLWGEDELDVPRVWRRARPWFSRETWAE
jgi:hypothetical protein